jgi:single-strand DNA-binding protein
MNVWNFTGNIGRDAETRFTPAGDAVTGFSVAVKAGYGDKATTTWVNCNIWGKRGETLAQYLVKGALVGISGECSLREYQDKEGQKKASLDVRVNDVTLLGKKPEGKPSRDEGYHTPPSRPEPKYKDPFGDDSDLPF